MRNATISTSRTRATADAPLIDYRPLPASFGDREGLRAVRAAKSRAARRGEDPSTLQLPALRDAPAAPRPAREPHPGREPRRPGLLALLRRAPGIHRRGERGGRLLHA
ncbi:MAG TPA: hypothetical protein K8V81_03445 [Brachybacterium massiliense]|uniref:Uncharacterized protein n=1 Tax=Brachybacterium massiliense TaxID=1755098 RepID=A0A921SWP9_9MICO|nr:hypothetical protein [Brachybacterium massiliense]